MRALMAITADVAGLAGDGVALAGSAAGFSAPTAVAPGSDPVSQAAAALLGAQSAALTVVVNHAAAQRVHGGAVLHHTAATLRAVDGVNGSRLAGVVNDAATPADGDAPVGALPTALPPAPVIPVIPTMPALPMLPGEQLAAALHSGPGSTALREFARACQADADSLHDLAEQMRQRAAGIAAHWIDGHHRAAVNTADHANWLNDAAAHASTLAARANDVADLFDQAKAATPSPEEFAQTREEIARARALNAASGGLHTAEVVAATQKFAHQQTEATEAALAYHAGVSSATAQLGEPLSPAPPIARGHGETHALSWGGRPQKPPPDVPSPEPINDPVWRIAGDIAEGHAWKEHAAKDFPGLTKEQLQRKVYEILRAPDAWTGQTPHGTTMVLRDGVVVIYDPMNPDKGTIFRPKGNPLDYFNDGTLKETRRGGAATGSRAPVPEAPKPAPPTAAPKPGPAAMPPATPPSASLPPMGGGVVEAPGFVDPNPSNEPGILGDDPEIRGSQ